MSKAADALLPVDDLLKVVTDKYFIYIVIYNINLYLELALL